MHQPGQTQVKDFYNPLGGQQEIGRFEVSMNQAVFVDALESKGRLPDDLTGIGGE
jgi:hypothetical protein